MKVGAFEFNLRGLVGSMVDFGTLFPLAIGYASLVLRGGEGHPGSEEAE